jgi:phospholipase/carboxylesterase
MVVARVGLCLGLLMSGLAWAGDVSSAVEVAAPADPTATTPDQAVPPEPDAPVAVVSPDASPAASDLGAAGPTEDPRGAAASTRALSYLEWTARPHAPTEALPTVIVLHGWGGTPERILPIAQFEDLDVRVIAPQAPLRSGRGYTWIAHMREDGTPKSATAEADASMADLVALVERLRAERPMVGKPVLVGFSLGGAMAYGLSVYHPELFEQVLILSGPMPPRILPERASPEQAALPVRAAHIERDPIVPSAPSKATILKMAEAGFDATFEAFPGSQHRVSDLERAWLHDAIARRWSSVLGASD